MGLLDDTKQRLLAELDEAKQHLLKDQLPQDVENMVLGKTAGQDQFVLLGRSIGKVMGFRILRSGETGFPHLELTFTDRGIYFYNGQEILGGTNATYQGFLDQDLVFYGQGNGMSVAETDPRTSSTWCTEGVAKLEPNLTGAGTYRGSILYRWAPGPFAVLNPMPAVFELVINNWGITHGTIWRWVQPDSSTDTSETTSADSTSGGATPA
ncbi:MAG TPA: hypothetical protein VGC66_06970 [Pyrinomonadaceae bacterium]|jgi:hypothetical protein